MYFLRRLRPYFLTLCNPTLTRSDCLDQNQFTKYVVNFTCNTNGDEDYEKEISDASNYHIGEITKKFQVKCAKDFLEIEIIQKEGKKPISVKDFINGNQITDFFFIS